MNDDVHMHSTVVVQGLNQKRIVLCSYCTLISNLKLIMNCNIIKNLVKFCLNNDYPLIIGSDSNAHSSSWGCEDTNKRGIEFDNLIINQDLIINNIGNTPTFVNHLGSSIIDITITNSLANSMISNWHVDTNDSLSDHRYIEYNLNFAFNPSNSTHRNWKKADWSTFTKLMQSSSKNFTLNKPFQMYTKDDIENESTLLTEMIQMNIDIVCPKKKAIGRDPQSWWTKEINTLRKDLRRIFRILSRKWPRNNGPNPERQQQLWSYYRSGKKELKKIIQKAKRQAWRDFCTNMTYKDIARTVKNKNSVPVHRLSRPDGTFTDSPAEALKVLFDTHLPGSTSPVQDEMHHPIGKDLADDLIIHESITSLSIESFGKYKAPGPDGIPAVVLQHLDSNSITKLTQLYNAMLYTSYTPKAWRYGKVIFISKPGKTDYTNPRSFRPITLSNVLIKVLEKIMTWHNKATTKIDKLPNQLGFKAGHSTEDALSRFTDRVESGLMRGRFVIVTFLDFQSAFDLLQFQDVFNSFSKLGVNQHLNHWYSYYLRKSYSVC